MKSRTTIFLSGVSHELGSFRDAVETEIQRKGCFAENQPSFAPDYRTVEEMLRRRLHDSDAMIHIVGFRFGAEPKQRPPGERRRSYTQMELDIAREMRKPVYVFLSNDASLRDAPNPDEKPEEQDASALQLAHREDVQGTDHIYYFFKDKAELCRLVAGIPSVEAAGRMVDISRIMKYAPAHLIGRDDETESLSQAWMRVRRAESPRPHILTFVALGGEGKTALVAKWAADLAFQDWPGCDAALAWSFYSQGTREQLAASSDLFLNEALTFFGDAAMAGSAAGAFDKGKRLAQLVGERRALLILDGLEPLQYAPTSPTPGELKDLGLAALLKGLAATSHGLCVVTTRYSIPDLRGYLGKTVEEKKLERLSTEAGVALLQSFGVKGSLRKTIPGADGRTLLNELEKLVEDVKGHALTLNLLGSYLRDAHAGDIRKRDLIKLEEADAEEQGGHAFRVMDAYVAELANGGKTADDQAKGRRALALLRLLGLFDRPATADTLAALWEGEAIAGLTEPLTGISEAQRNLALQRLEDARLLTVNRAHGSGVLVALDAHPLLREYFGQRLRDAQPEAWRAAHLRLYEHLCATTQDKPDATLEDLQPLYQAVAHGCQAGRGDDAYKIVYEERIERGDRRYATRELAAVGLDLSVFSNFFEAPWTELRTELKATARGQLVGMAGSGLRAVGRMAEAFEAFSASFDQRTGDSIDDAFRARHLSEILLLLGNRKAIEQGELAVRLADESEDRKKSSFERVAERAVLADALFHFGKREDALAMFQKAEQIQGDEKHADRLHSLWGFRYCMCLLDEPANWLWKRALTKNAVGPFSGKVMAGLQERAEFICEEANKRRLVGLGLLDHALGKLCLGIVELFRSFVASDERRVDTVLGEALNLLRTTCKVEFLPPALLMNSWQRVVCNDRVGAISDLDEAWEIAERGPMPLFLADIHLYRARLFFREAQYPWDKNPDGTPRGPKDDLAAARRLIFKHGYLRRKEELEDAEGFILGTPELDHR